MSDLCVCGHYAEQHDAQLLYCLVCLCLSLRTADELFDESDDGPKELDFDTEG